MTNSMPLFRLAFASWLVLPSAAQFPLISDTNLTSFSAPHNDNVTISYKSPDGACTTVFDDQEQWSGWVNVKGQEYPVNLFFWFVAAREPSDLLTIWLSGGPGTSSMFGFFDEIGPCEVIETGKDRLDTAAREWGWDRASNMLFIDQPNQVGFSYDVLTNASVDLEDGSYMVPPQEHPQHHSPITFLNGTFSSHNVTNTANTTELAAANIWHMMQGFLYAFPQYNPANATSLGINLFAESYGGHFGPVFADVWEEENAKILNTTQPNNTTTAGPLPIHLKSLGIVNGCVDDLIQGPSYPAMMRDNAYGLEVVSKLHAELINSSFYAEGGCQELIHKCREAASTYDPDNDGDVAYVNRACQTASDTCTTKLVDPYGASARSVYDLAHRLPESFPPSLYVDYLNDPKIQQALGASLNFTETCQTVFTAFSSTGDHARGPIVPKIADLLRSGVRIGLMYGDRDFACNWMGGEAVSLAIANWTGAPYDTQFPSSGYAPIIVNDSYIGGVVREFGNLSFSRVYQAGHWVPSYQPETAFQVFARIIMGTAVSTGQPIDLDTYMTDGPDEADETLDLPDSPSATCYLRSLSTSCSDDQLESVKKGDGLFINGIWYAHESDWHGPTATPTPTSTSDGGGGGHHSGGDGGDDDNGNGGGGHDGNGDHGQSSSDSGDADASSSMVGLYTATATPDPDQDAGGRLRSQDSMVLLALLAFCAFMLPHV